MRRSLMIGVVATAAVGGVWGLSAPRPERAIVGRWRWADTGDEAEFFPDGQLKATVAVESAGGRQTLHYVGSYWFVARDRLLMDSSDIAGIPLQGAVMVAVDGDELRFTRDDGTVLVARRVE
jgi:hypothetical protein